MTSFFDIFKICTSNISTKTKEVSLSSTWEEIQVLHFHRSLYKEGIPRFSNTKISSVR